MRANEEPVQIIGSLGSIFIKLFRCHIPSNSLNRNGYCLCNLGILLVTAGSVPRFSSQFDLTLVFSCHGLHRRTIDSFRYPISLLGCPYLGLLSKSLNDQNIFSVVSLKSFSKTNSLVTSSMSLERFVEVVKDSKTL